MGETIHVLTALGLAMTVISVLLLCEKLPAIWKVIRETPLPTPVQKGIQAFLLSENRFLKNGLWPRSSLVALSFAATSLVMFLALLIAGWVMVPPWFSPQPGTTMMDPLGFLFYFVLWGGFAFLLFRSVIRGGGEVPKTALLLALYPAALYFGLHVLDCLWHPWPFVASLDRALVFTLAILVYCYLVTKLLKASPPRYAAALGHVVLLFVVTSLVNLTGLSCFPPGTSYIELGFVEASRYGVNFLFDWISVLVTFRILHRFTSTKSFAQRGLLLMADAAIAAVCAAIVFVAMALDNPSAVWQIATAEDHVGAALTIVRAVWAAPWHQAGPAKLLGLSTLLPTAAYIFALGLAAIGSKLYGTLKHFLGPTWRVVWRVLAVAIGVLIFWLALKHNPEAESSLIPSDRVLASPTEEPTQKWLSTSIAHMLSQWRIPSV